MWEYKIVNTKISEEELNYLGQSGWELVAIDTNPHNFYRWVFKRPRKGTARR